MLSREAQSHSQPVFPDGFLWGTATAAHQVEGSCVNNDVWLYEHVQGSIYTESSGDAIDHYHRYADDIALLAELGYGAYRFSLEWSRIEPAEGEFSEAELAHYRRVLECCHRHGITPIVTYHHFTSPVWLIREGGWEAPTTPQRFARFARVVTERLGDLFDIACTLNEPNLAVLLAEYGMAESRREDRASNLMWQGVGEALGIAPEDVAGFQLSGTEESMRIKIAAHHAAVDAIKSVKPTMRCGWTLANADIQARPGGEEYARELRQRNNIRFLEESRGDDFVGIQTYNRAVFTAEGMADPRSDAAVTPTGEEIWPWAIGNTIREAWEIAGVPIIVTENGLNTEDDSQRVEFLTVATTEVGKAITDGVDVRGYMCWSTFDNFEWVFGYGPKFGIIAVDRTTQERHVKESARVLARIAATNGAILVGG
ncbi:glycoside hydrolase family 1 protein [Nanchangia anserum]|uniref:glycoside hydrolase family 1 protein n=1 Tax=Nanchangia anserum TaxID=2692125 RepID=UPI001883F35A|nr:family 1 glycosylhydrolase [Nanchangia anserum]QOX81963.1 glycoside hydrolase family 1 protein [Nanchangia anserum]